MLADFVDRQHFNATGQLTENQVQGEAMTLSNEEIASVPGFTEAGAKSHLNSIFAKPSVQKPSRSPRQGNPALDPARRVICPKTLCFSFYSGPTRANLPKAPLSIQTHAGGLLTLK